MPLDGSNVQEGRGHRILLAEDDPTNEYVFQAILKGAGYQIEVFPNGLAALEHAQQDRPDLFVLDMMMPVMDGYETARRIAADPFFDDIPIVALTAQAMRGDLEKCLEAGCDGYMSKPVSRRALLDTVGYWLDRNPSEWMPSRLAKREAEAKEA